MRRLPLFLSLLLVAALSVVVAPPASAACQPGPPVYDPSITSPDAAIPGFTSSKASSQQLRDYVDQVDGETSRVTAGVFATTVKGTPLSYALVSTPENIANLPAIVAANEALRDPRVTNASQAAALAHTTPAIVWYMANVHGNEPAGGDAALKILYDLAARTDCEVEDMLQNLVVGIIPTQNPDGRDANTRTNANGFDMNRDWFEQSQPETIGKIRLLVRYPGVLYMDAHEMFYNDFFFPPTADPTYHEISDTTMNWINTIYGPAMADAFHARQQGDNFTFFNYSPYDFFAIVYGDTVPDTLFTGAGMTFEKGTQDQYSERVLEHYVAGVVVDQGRLGSSRTDPERALRVVRPGDRRGHGRNARAEHGPAARQYRAAPGARHQDPQLLPGSRPGVSGGRPDRRPTDACRGGRVPAERAADRSQRTRVRTRGRPADAAGRHVLDPHGPAPEALDPGHAR
jgi:hypothetical protein